MHHTQLLCFSARLCLAKPPMPIENTLASCSPSPSDRPQPYASVGHGTVVKEWIDSCRSKPQLSRTLDEQLLLMLVT